MSKEDKKEELKDRRRETLGRQRGYRNLDAGKDI